MKFKFLKLSAAALFTVAFTQCNDTPQEGPGNGQPKDTTSTTHTLPPNAKDSVFPYTLEFVPKTYSGKPLPCLQSYQAAVASDGSFLIVSGRRQGLHTFMGAPATNFVKDSANNYLFVIDPVSGNQWSFNVNQLSGKYSAPLKSTNAQSCFDRSTGQMYFVGGYGWKADSSDMVTFGTIMRFNVDSMVKAIKAGANAAKITSLIEIDSDDRFAVTGGELFNMNGQFYLVFGQKFTGQYRAFGGTDFTQKYNEQVAVFTLKPNTLKILGYGTTTNNEPGRPFHRRDGNIIDDLDPATGQARITAFGGVFQPGIIGAYTYPIFINSPAAPTLNRNVNQKFSQYECPVISVYDSSASNQSIYRTFFGGIGHYYYYQTPSQKAIYDTATHQGRNDGFPFLEDITTWVEKAGPAGGASTWTEWIHVDPVPGNRLLGATAPFLVTPAMFTQGMVYENGIVNLSKFQKNTKTLIGYIYGGIEAQNPLPYHPNTGTFVSNTVFEVYLNYTPAPGIPSSEAHESTKSDANMQRK
jgi:hypothetical protein